MAEPIARHLEAKVRDIASQIVDLINSSGPLSDEDMSLYVSAMEQADQQQIELLRTYVRAMSDNGLASAARVATLLKISIANEMSGRIQTKHFLKKEVLEKKE